MVPDLSLSEEASIRASEFEIARAVNEDPAGVAALCAGLVRQCSLQQNMLAKATQRICELEAQQAIAGPDEWMATARELRPRPRRWLRWPW